MAIETKSKQFVYRPSCESLLAFRSASAEDRLNWLEEARRFVEEFVPARKLEKWRIISGK